MTEKQKINHKFTLKGLNFFFAQNRLHSPRFSNNYALRYHRCILFRKNSFIVLFRILPFCLQVSVFSTVVISYFLTSLPLRVAAYHKYNNKTFTECHRFLSLSLCIISRSCDGPLFCFFICLLASAVLRRSVNFNALHTWNTIVQQYQQQYTFVCMQLSHCYLHINRTLF